MYTAKPTKKLLEWQDMEIGVIIHYCMEIYRPDITERAWYKNDTVRTALAPETIHPTKLDPEQWVRSAAHIGAKYAVLVTNHCTGFSLWNTKVNDFSIASTDFRGGGGDVCREFVDACKKYGIRPGFYYSTGCNGYYNINDSMKQDYTAEYYKNYVKCVEAQVEELWSQYGELFEIWFDGGIVPVEKGGPDLVPLLKKYQPNAVCFQGPKGHPNNIRWMGNEDGCAPENCWATTFLGEAAYDGTVPDEEGCAGNPDGIYYIPAETDVPNRNKKAFGGGWAWKAGEEQYVYTPEELLGFYIRSVGRNTNLLLGMAISTDGDFQDEEQLKAFGQLLREKFGTPLCKFDGCKPVDGRITVVNGSGKVAAYFSVREDITEGQHVRGFRLLADGKLVYEGRCIGHKRIIPLDGIEAREFTLEITDSFGDVVIRDICLY